MHHTPEEYGEYWGGAIRIAGGVFLALVGYRAIVPFIEHPAPGATLFGYLILGLTILAGAFAATLGLAMVIKTAVRAA